MSEIVIKVGNLSKQYRIGAKEGYRTFRETLVDAAKAPFQGISKLLTKNSKLKTQNSKDTIWALNNVSFEVKRGEVVGIIGRNGAGKSTLLKILSKITEPSEGRVELRGRVGSLLEVGTGFHPELTGHENIYLYGAILGMDRWEISRKFDEIVTFAELEKFIDTPVKRYSSGMYMRLAFAVAAHLEPEVMLVDEVLAVGDSSFQKKCLGKMDDVSKEGRTVLFVSHNLGAITRLCKKTLCLDGGTVVDFGNSREIVSRYQLKSLDKCAHWNRNRETPANSDFSFLSVSVKNDEGRIVSVFGGNEPISVEIDYIVHRSLSGCQVGARIYNYEGVVIFTTADSDDKELSALPKEAGRYQSLFTIPGNFLIPGSFYISIAAHLPGRNSYESFDYTVVFEISSSDSLASLDGRQGVIAPLLKWITFKKCQI